MAITSAFRRPSKRLRPVTKRCAAVTLSISDTACPLILDEQSIRRPGTSGVCSWFSFFVVVRSRYQHPTLRTSQGLATRSINHTGGLRRIWCHPSNTHWPHTRLLQRSLVTPRNTCSRRHAQSHACISAPGVSRLFMYIFIYHKL